MALYKGEQKLKAFKGDYKPVNIYKGNEKIAGWEYEEKTGESLAFEGTYNDSAYVKINGKTEEIGTGDKAPDNLYELKSVCDFDLISEGEQLQTIHIPHELHSLPNGVCDYIDLVRGEGERRVMKLIFDGSEYWNGYAVKSDVYIGFYSYAHPIIGTGGDGTDITRANWLPFSSSDVYNQRSNAFWVNTDGRVYISIERSIIGATPEETPEEARPKWLNFLASQPLIVMAEREVPEAFSIAPQMINTYYPYTQIYTISEIKPTLEGKVKIMGGQ